MTAGKTAECCCKIYKLQKSHKQTSAHIQYAYMVPIGAAENEKQRQIAAAKQLLSIITAVRQATKSSTQLRTSQHTFTHKDMKAKAEQT